MLGIPHDCADLGRRSGCGRDHRRASPVRGGL